MNLDGLRYFVTIAECGSFSKASETLYVSQPALSRCIQRLEEEFGSQLFIRSRKEGVLLTELGRACLKDAQKVIFYSDQIQSKVEAHACGSSGTITIGYVGMERRLIYSLTALVRALYPNIKVLLNHESMDGVVRCTIEETVDVSFIFKGFGYHNEDMLEFLPIRNSRMKLLVMDSHPLAKRQSVCIAEIRNEPIVSWYREMFPPFYDAFHQLCRQHGFSPNIVCKGETHAVLSYICAGDGIGYTFSGVEDTYALPGICSIDITREDGAPMPTWQLCLAWNKNNTNPCIRAIRNIVQMHIKNQDTTLSII